MIRPIRIWRFEDAPDKYRHFSLKANEDIEWVIYIPKICEDELCLEDEFEYLIKRRYKEVYRLEDGVVWYILSERWTEQLIP